MFIYCLLEAKSDTKFWEYNDGKTRPPTYKGSNPEERVEDQRYFATSVSPTNMLFVAVQGEAGS